MTLADPTFICPQFLQQRWEARRDAGSGMNFFIDHEAKKTYWEEELPAEGRAALQRQQQQPRNGALMHASASAPDLAQTARSVTTLHWARRVWMRLPFVP